MGNIADKDYQFKIHPLAALFPELSPEEFKKLKADIQAHGQRDPIMVTTDDVLLDGRHRLRACKELGISPAVEHFPLNGTIRQLRPGIGLLDYRCTEEDYIWSRNVLRRHLTDDQRAAIGLKWADTIRDAAKQRMKDGAKGLVDSPNPVHTREAVAKKAGVSTHKVRQVEAVAKQAPQLLPKVESGELKLKDAVKEVKPKPEPPAFDEGSRLSTMYSAWAATVDRNWPKNRDLTPVIRKVYAFATYLEKLEKVRAAELQRRVQSVVSIRSSRTDLNSLTDE